MFGLSNSYPEDLLWIVNLAQSTTAAFLSGHVLKTSDIPKN